MHIDLNAFFATAEILRDPSLEGKPLIVGGDGRGGIVSTCSYEARKYGVHSGMPTFKAKKLCPGIIIKPCDFRLYSVLSNEFFAFVRNYTKIIEIASIDECYADMTEALKNVVDVHAYLFNLQQALFKKTGLKCSIGVASTKFLAKMASDLKKPMGITIIRRKDISSLLYPLKIESMYGIGKKTAPRLQRIGITTIGDLAKRVDDEDQIVKDVVGKFFYTIKDWLHGYGNDEVSTEPWDPKSIGASRTFDNDTSDVIEIEKVIKNLANEVSSRAKKESKAGTTIQIVMKNTDFKSMNKSVSFEIPTNNETTIYSKSCSLFEKVYKGETLRLVGVTLQNLINPKYEVVQMTLFNYEQYEDANKTKLIINDINRKLKKPLLKRAAELKADKKSNVK